MQKVIPGQNLDLDNFVQAKPKLAGQLSPDMVRMRKMMEGTQGGPNNNSKRFFTEASNSKDDPKKLLNFGSGRKKFDFENEMDNQFEDMRKKMKDTQRRVAGIEDTS